MCYIYYTMLSFDVFDCVHNNINYGDHRKAQTKLTDTIHNTNKV